MKKFTLLASLTFLFIFASCNFGINKNDSELGTVYIVLDKNNPRSVLVNKDNVTEYEFTLSGSNNYSKTIRFDNTSLFFFDNVPAGNYTLSGKAFNGNVYVSASTPVTVEPFKNSYAKLLFSALNIIDTKFVLPNYYFGAKGTTASLKTFDSPSSVKDIVDINLDLKEKTINPNINLVAETVDGTVYFIYENETGEAVLSNLATPNNNLKITYNGKSVSYITNEQVTFQFLRCDYFTDTLYLFGTIENSFSAYTLDPSNGAVINSYTIELPNIQNIRTSSITAITVANNLIYVAYGSSFSIFELVNNEYVAVKLCNFENGTYIEKSETSITLSEFSNLSEFNNCKIPDMVVSSNGVLNMLVSQCGTISGGFTDGYLKDREITVDENGNTENYTYVSRGAFIEFSVKEVPYLNSDNQNAEGGFCVSSGRTIGWYNEAPYTIKETGEFKLGTFEKDVGKAETDYITETDRVNTNNISSLNVLLPKKSERNNYLIGPVKFVCIKPDELYIVDSGFSFRLADWTAESLDPNQKGRSASIFYTDRIVKVDLKSSALQFEVVKTQTKACSPSKNCEPYNGPDKIMPVFSNISLNTSVFNYFGNKVEVPTGSTTYQGIYPWGDDEEI